MSDVAALVSSMLIGLAILVLFFFFSFRDIQLLLERDGELMSDCSMTLERVTE